MKCRDTDLQQDCSKETYAIAVNCFRSAKLQRPVINSGEQVFKNVVHSVNS